ncbi:MAG: hypothetical protein QOG13_433 [Sphingomonadales bacterium]|nr:hypothetical protein [Sphingomonadales bacterium]
MFALPVAKPQKKVAPAPSLQRKVGPPLPAGLQRKIVVGKSNDPLEREADRVADQVMAMAGPIGPLDSAPPQLSRACAACEDDEKAQMLQGKLDCAQAVGGEAPDIVREVLGSSGEPLDPSARAYFEPRFQSGFGRVRVHAGARAADSAAAIKARAYTVGHDIAFADRQYRPGSREGRRLIAHELAHVVQQGGAGPARGGTAATLRRADRNAVSQVMKMRDVVGAGIQFFPTKVTDTKIGPVTVQGGLASHGTSRLNIIVGANLTPRVLARQLLPLWITATPFTPQGGGPAVELGKLSEEQLAQGLLVYNQHYLPVPAMTEWRAGLHFPLPVEIEEKSGIATVNPDMIRSLAGVFDPSWSPQLDQPAAAVAAPAAANVQADVAAFLAAEPTALARGIGLAARALTNAQASLPFIREAFAQLGADGFDVVLAMVDELIVGDMALLAGQRDGDEIFSEIVTALNTGAAALSPAQNASFNRLMVMFGQVAAIRVANPPAPVPGRPEKTVSIDTIKLDGSTANPATQVAVANTIFAQCNIRFAHGVDETAKLDPATKLDQTRAWLGADRIVKRPGSCGGSTAEERRMFQGATAAFGLSARIRAFFVLGADPSVAGYANPVFCAPAELRNMIVVTNKGDTSVLAHEIGHILANVDGHTSNTLMTKGWPQPNELADNQCARMYKNA